MTSSLGEKHIVVSPRFESVRMSPHVCNTEEDVSKVTEELKKIIGQKH